MKHHPCTYLQSIPDMPEMTAMENAGALQALLHEVEMSQLGLKAVRTNACVPVIYSARVVVDNACHNCA